MIVFACLRCLRFTFGDDQRGRFGVEARSIFADLFGFLAM